MKQIPLSQGYFALVDDEDFEWLNQWKWHALVRDGNRTSYAKRSTWETGGVRKAIKMHRAILGVTDQNILIDHIDGNGLNNCRSNLRITDGHGNARNRRVNKTVYSGFKGVHWIPHQKSFVARIACDGKQKHLGTSECPKTCARTYNKYAKELFGDFAKLNEVEDGPLCPTPLPPSNVQSGFRGVTWNRNLGKWKVSFTYRYKAVFTATITDVVVAAKTYDKKAFEYLGFKAKLNFPEDYAHLKTEQP